MQKIDDLKPRLLQSADATEIMRILSQVYRDDNPYPVGGGWTMAQIESELEKGCGLGIFGESYRLRAFVVFSKVGPNYEINLLATDIIERRQGLMITLLECLRRSWAEGKEIWLEVHEGNSAARKLYEKQGFTAEGRRPGYYRDGGAAILYTLR